MRGNETRNQHFVSQVEQRLNASNPNSTGGNFRIYSFRIADREASRIELENPRGRAIVSTLSMLDLFSFDVPGGGPLRMNLEALFHKYEAKVEIHTKGLLEKLAAGSTDIKTELIDLFAVKLLNFIRNPFCIQKVLNSFPGVGQYEPTDPELLAVYRRIVNGQKPHQAHLCRQLDVSQETYVEWLRLIFVLLMQIGDDRTNLFEGMIKALFEARDTQAAAFVWIYDQDVCLLSDRSYCQPIPDGAHMAMSFNLCSSAFADYVFADAATLVEGRAAPAFGASALAAWRQRSQATINVTVTKNNRPMLARYNRQIIEQARERVYCAEKAGIVLA
ncbi:hypothetical protein FBZ99_11173 [Rhizobium sp. ERR 1071]|uniref:hypothetical protein n=1 Tax=Rhizobium sp. ERR 1071 TaxID=2572677 RepID=UPI00119C4D2D|nr:hypothetical protein [Rhizobium sp. ERR1071]TWB10585.1 hypothetical protein FBZ99_11173 [Rhizobium sp. ERR1071]